MKNHKCWAAIGKGLAVVIVAFTAVLMLASAASAAATYKILHKFNGTDGATPQDDHLTFDAVGNLYGTTVQGGAFGQGSVFELSPNSDGTWSESVLYSFTGGNDGAVPVAGLIFDANSNLYGTAANGGAYGSGTVFQLSPGSSGWTESVLYSFTGGGDGQIPMGGLIFDATGALYGTTAVGGADGEGTVYKLTPNPVGPWTETVLYSFKNHIVGDPDRGSLIFDSAGDLYGTTDGEHNSQCCGEVYELIPQPDGSWQIKVLRYLELGNGGYSGDATLIFDPAGNLYSTASWGGGKGCPQWAGCGVVYKLIPGSDGKWKEQVIYRFKGGKDGQQPYAGVVFDATGNLYGTTLHGGGGSCSGFWGGSGCGTVYKLTPNAKGGWTEHVIHRFRGAAGGNPWGGLVLDGNGNIYGTVSGQGTSGSSGAVFEITP